MMKTRISHVDQLIELLVESFKENQNLPYIVKTTTCSDKKKNCKKRHGEFVIESFNKEDKYFLTALYSMHIPEVISTQKYSEEMITGIIKRSMEKTSYGKKPFLPVKQLEKLVEKGKVYKQKRLSFRVNDSEYNEIKLLAKKQGIEVSDYLRKQLFSNTPARSIV